MEWDEKKNKKNIKKHNGISFEQASCVFEDPNAIEFLDEEHSTAEEIRFGCIGMSKALNFLVVTVFYTDRSGQIRIISARPANQKERGAYYERLREIYR